MPHTPEETAAQAWRDVLHDTPEAEPVTGVQAVHASVFFTPGSAENATVVLAATLAGDDLEALDALLLAVTHRRIALARHWERQHGEPYFPGAYSVAGR